MKVDQNKFKTNMSSTKPTSNEAENEALRKSDVVGRSEQLVCDCELPSNNFELDDGTICCCRCEKTIAN